MQLQYFLSWNKANIKHNCKSQLYTFYWINKALMIIVGVTWWIRVWSQDS